MDGNFVETMISVFYEWMPIKDHLQISLLILGEVKRIKTSIPPEITKNDMVLWWFQGES